MPDADSATLVAILSNAIKTVAALNEQLGELRKVYTAAKRLADAGVENLGRIPELRAQRAGLERGYGGSREDQDRAGWTHWARTGDRSRNPHFAAT